MNLPRMASALSLKRIIMTILVGVMAQSTTARELNVDALHGRVVYLDFWASWCTPCRQEFPWLNEMQQAYGTKGFTIVAVNVDENRQLAEQFLHEQPANFHVLFDPAGTIASKFHIEGMPTAIILDRNGKVRFKHTGFKPRDEDEYEHNFASLLADRGGDAQ
jgi:cytochrome c biogenesis protein CcmG/thiol:disulfide interchange protein DsbE